MGRSYGRARSLRYGDNDLQEFIADSARLGSVAALASVPASVALRGKAKLQQLFEILSECGALPTHTEPPAGPALAGDGRQNNLFLGRVVAAAVNRDASALEDLADIGDPLDELRKLVKAAKQGEPIKDLEPDEVALRATKSSIRGKKLYPVRRA